MDSKVGGLWYRELIHPMIPYHVPGRNLAYSISLPWQERYTEGVSLQSFQREMEFFLRILFARTVILCRASENISIKLQRPTAKPGFVSG